MPPLPDSVPLDSNGLPLAFVEWLEESGHTWESTKQHIKDHDQFPDEEPEEMLVYALNWAYFCCPGVFDYHVAQYHDYSSGWERWGVFLDFETPRPHNVDVDCDTCYLCEAWEAKNERFWASVISIENIAAKQGLDMRYSGMTREWKEVIAKHVQGIVLECYRDSGCEYPDRSIHFFEDILGNIPISVLILDALVY